jgi:hypothetical protein
MSGIGRHDDFRPKGSGRKEAIMVKIRFEKTFRHNPSIVFAALIDSEHKSSWDTEVIEEHLEPVGPVQVGSKVHQTRRFMGQHISSVSMFQELEPDRMFLITEAPGEQYARGRCEIEPIPGGCRMVKHFELGVSDLIAPLVTFGVRQSLKKRFQNLERLLDAQASTSNLVAA